MKSPTWAQLAAEYSAYARKMLSFGLEAHSYQASLGYLSQAVEYQKTSADLYRADRLDRGLGE